MARVDYSGDNRSRPSKLRVTPSINILFTDEAKRARIETTGAAADRA
jgi:hypothetical protein